jgi:tetratricopeptide (TPR) repeat protein
MWMRNEQFNRVGALLAAVVALGGVGAIASPPAVAQTLFEQQGTLKPMQAEYTFAGTAGDTVTIAMNSPDFDTYLVLLSPSGEELATNDDYARSLNSTIVFTLPSTGTYKVLARSFSGQGGNYVVTVANATPFEQAYAKASSLYMLGEIDAALAAFNQAIQADPTQPMPYLDRGDIYYSQGNTDAVRADYQQALRLYERAGNTEMVQVVRDQLTYLDAPAEPVPEPRPIR